MTDTIFNLHPYAPIIELKHWMLAYWF